jgi:hypothetical protein
VIQFKLPMTASRHERPARLIDVATYLRDNGLSNRREQSEGINPFAGVSLWCQLRNARLHSAILDGVALLFSLLPRTLLVDVDHEAGSQINPNRRGCTAKFGVAAMAAELPTVPIGVRVR